jgi:hypothetical protein
MRNFSLIRGLQVTGTEAVKVLIGRCNCINQDGQMTKAAARLGTPLGCGGRRLVVRFIITVTHRGRRGARPARREEGEYRQYLTDEQRRGAGCIDGRMPA